MTRFRLPLVRLLAAAFFALLCLMIPLDAGAQSTPAAPTIDSVTSGDTTLAVAWSAPAGATGITAYDVRHIETSADETDDANWAVEDNAWTSGTLEYTITMLDNGTQYDVQVRAVNSNGDGTWSATEVGTPALPAPTIDSVRADDRAVLVSWSAPTGITTGVGAYDVRYIETGADETMDSNWTVEEDGWKDGGGSLAYPITGLTNGTEYDVQVRAVDENNVDGAWSATTSATPADHGDTQATAASVTADARVWGAIDPTDDEDYFSFSVSSTADYWIYTLGDLDTVGELLDSGGMSIDTSDRGGVLPNPDNFFLWHRLESGTYYIKVTGFGLTDEPYILRVREFTDTTSRSNAATLEINGFASGTIDPEEDDDYFKLELSEATEVAIRASGFPDTVGELQRSNGTVIASNDDGYLPGGRRNFLIRERLNAGVYYVKVSSFAESSDGPYSVHAAAITEPGSAIADAQPLTLGGTAGGIIDPAGDEDYFSLTLSETTYLTIGGVSDGTNISGALTDENNLQARVDSIHFDDLFIFEGRLDAGTYHLKVTGKDGTETGRYTVRAIEQGGYTYFVDRCSNIMTSGGINDPLYGCQWHLNNNDQFRNSSGHDIRVEEVWPTYTGSGINVAVVDDGMHHQHEDLTDNVLTSFNHNYDPDLTDIYHPFEDHGTAVAGLIAAKDNSLGMRGVAPEAKIYGYNYLVEQSDENEANAMSRNAATTAISNNSWGPGDSGRPEPATELWEAAVKDGVTNGYGGKGVFYAWAAGNGGDDDDYSTLDEYSNFYAVTAVCAVGPDDKRSEYSELGSNLWVCGPSNSGRVGQPGIATTDNGHRYRGNFGGTSAATPIVSGVVALIREANNALTWRDVKLILAASARKNDPDNTGWEEGAFKYGSTTDRYNYNHEYGFGMVDAKAAVDLASGWTNVRDLREITSESGVINLRIPDLPSSGTPTTVTASLTVDPYVDFVEFVEVNARFNHPFFRDLTVELVSPSRAVSTLSTSAPIDGDLTTRFRFGSARHLGENAAGEWTLRIKDAQDGDTGALRSWGLTIYGHGFVPGEPEIDAVTPGGGTLEIDWKAPTDTGETAITSYDLRYIRDDATDRSDGNWSVETGVGTPSNRSYTITGLRGGVKYEIQLRAHNDAGQGPWSQSEADEPTTVAPSAPSISSVTRGDRSLGVVWTAPTNTGGGVITAYDVRYIETSEDETVESNWTVRDNAWRSGDLGYVISNLTNSTEYDVQVRAVNSAGDGAWSGTETGTPRLIVAVTLQWEETSIEVAEDAGSVVLRAVFTTTLDAPPVADFTFDVTMTTTDSGTTQNDDYTAPPSSATFVATDFSQTGVNGQQRYRATRDFTVVIIDDMDDESNETFNVTLAYLTPGLTHLQGGPSTAVVTIQDNEHVPVTLSWEQTDVTVGENAGSATLRAYAITTVDKQPEDGFSFDASISTSDGSAAQPGDYTQVDDTVTFSRNDFSRVTVNGERRYRAAKQVPVTIQDDTSDEPYEEDFTVTIEYANRGPSHLQGGSATTSVKITDNDFVPVTISWDQSAVSVDEDATTVTLQARATTTSDKMPESGITVALSATTADDTATQGSDYRRLTSSFSFGQSDFTRTDVGGQFRFQATRDISVSIIDDTVDEPDEDFTVTLSYSNPSLPHLQGGPDTATVTVADNDHVPVVLSWAAAAVTAVEPSSPGSTRPVSLIAVAVTTKEKMPESGFSFDVTVATANGSATQPADYEQLSDTATFNRSDFSLATISGQRRYRAIKTFTVLVTHDTVQEANETFTVTLAYADPSLPYLQGGSATATVTITDDISTTVDLSTTVFGSPFRVSRGEELTYDYTVRNDGPAASTNTVVTSPLDRAVSFVSATPADKCAHSGGATGGEVACRFDTLDANASEAGEIVVRVGPAASTDIAITSIATSDKLDRRPGDNTATESTELFAPPEKVRNLSPVQSSAAFIELSWTRPSDNGSPVTRYELERKETGGSYAPVTPGPGVAATTYRDIQVSAGTTYTYHLRAVNADGDAEWSNEATATARETPPPPITGGGGGGGPPPLGFVEGTSATRSVPENTPVGENVGEPVDATGEDLEYTLTGDDASAFSIVSGTGQLQTKAALDYETQASHTVMVTATDSSDASATIDVTINVDNVEEPGTVTLSSGRLTLGETIVATLTDPDGSITETTWLWERSLDKIAWTAIGGATSAEYTPVLEDAGHYLRVTASYSDGEGPSKAANGISDEPVQGSPPPVFSEGTSATRSVEENTAASEDIGGPVQATGDGLEYALDGQDAGSFDIVPETGQLQTGAALDHETKAAHTVTVTATDSSDASATIDVTINVDNVEESGTVTLSSDRFTVGETIVATLTDPDGSITETTWLWERSLDKISWTAIGGATSAEYTPVLEDAGHYLRVTASYSDGEGPDKTAHVISGATLGRALNPTGLSAVPGANPGEVSLSWTPSADAIAHWVWSVRSDGTNGRWTTGQAGAAVVSGLEAGITYWFAVMEWSPRADGSLAWSELSNWAQAQVERSPTGLSAEPGDNPGEVSLRWTPSANAIAYWVWSVKDDGSNGRWTAGQAGSAVVGDLEAGVAYWFVVIEELGQRDGASQWSAYSNWDRAMASEQLNPTGVGSSCRFGRQWYAIVAFGTSGFVLLGDVGLW